MGESSEKTLTTSFSRVSVSRESRFPLDDDDDDDQAGHPRLLVSHGPYLKKHALYNISKNQHVDLDVPELASKEVFFTSYGNWVVLIDLIIDSLRPVQTCGFCVLNITSGEKIRIPHKWHGRVFQCILSGPPTEPDCHLIILPEPRVNHLYYCRLDDGHFIEARWNFVYNYNTKITAPTAASFGGKTYLWKGDSLFELVFRGDRKLDFVPLVHVAVADELFRWPVKARRVEDFIVPVEYGEILVVRAVFDRYTDLFENVAYFKVFRIIMGNGNKECVEELTSIGNRALFLGKHGSTACFADGSSSGVRRNSIYYYWDNQDIFVYDFEDRSTTPLRPCPPVRSGIFSLCWV
ncbi:Unknown protein [Striga hermonthica]|uniref:KIB1-4 beta-propeller domain-containing protein n=1 Tax=Striga hermonthica TaxID=68872 RepID=A0A9N7RCA8_STRHE|nr:Unknown protein [Striga hermonthica]